MEPEYVIFEGYKFADVEIKNNSILFSTLYPKYWDFGHVSSDDETYGQFEFSTFTKIKEIYLEWTWEKKGIKLDFVNLDEYPSINTNNIFIYNIPEQTFKSASFHFNKYIITLLSTIDPHYIISTHEGKILAVLSGNEYQFGDMCTRLYMVDDNRVLIQNCGDVSSAVFINLE